MHARLWFPPGRRVDSVCLLAVPEPFPNIDALGMGVPRHDATTKFVGVLIEVHDEARSLVSKRDAKLDGFAGLRDARPAGLVLAMEVLEIDARWLAGWLAGWLADRVK